jgi:Type I restriction enzyme R protein N terminus (HSDR_N)
MNEEEIKIKYILPWLAETGVRSDEIQLERSFSLKIGKNTIVVNSPDRRTDSVGARLDILISRGGRNLLIVETKAQDLALTDEDRDQAISYARLVHPIAPYAVVTNGREFRLYDSLTKEQIQPSEISVRGFCAALPTNLIEEAQELFLYSSQENLLSFCKAQVNRELELIKGTISDLDKKYIPELHVTREAVSNAITRLNHGAKPGLILVGESGRGKTCDICWTVEHLLQSGQPVLFFNGLHIESDIVHGIASEFCWVFGGADSEIVTLKRLARLAQGKPLTIVVDGIDEWIHPSRAQHLSGLIAAAEAEKIKLIVGCKSSVVNEFLAIKGMPTHTKRLAEVVEIPIFLDKEFFGAIDKYRRAYAFSGAFEDEVLQEAKANPFLLRVLFDVAHNGNIKHLTFSSVDFFESYYKRLLEKTSNCQRAATTLKAIAGYLYDQNVDWLLEDELRTKLGLHVSDELMSDLFHGGILVRGDLVGASTIGFYFQQLRDYIVSFKAHNFHLKTDSTFQEELKKIVFPSMRGDVITLYYRMASLKHKNVLDGHLRENAQAYLRLYITIIDAEFPAIRSKFQPYTDGEIGFIGELFLQRKSLGLYGFRQISNKDDTIFFYPVNEILGKSNLGYLNGAGSLHLTGSANGFLGGMDAAHEVVNNEVIRQLQDLIKNGNLHELNCPALLTESVLQTVQNHKGIFAPLLENTIEGIKFPLSLAQIKECLWREKLHRHFHDELIREKRRQGTIQESWSGSYVSYSVSLTKDEHEQIETEVEQSIKLGTEPVFHAKYTDLEKLESFLLPCIEGLAPLMEEIVEPLFANEAKLKQECFRNTPLSIECASNYLIALFSQFLENYKIFVETNFPSFKEHFSLYASLPVHIRLKLGPTTPRGPHHMTHLDVYFSNSKSEHNRVEILEDNAPQDASYDFTLVDGSKYFESSHSTVKNIFQSHHGLHSSESEGMTLRKLLYLQIQKEMPAIEKALREKYGAKQN